MSDSSSFFWLNTQICSSHLATNQTILENKEVVTIKVFDTCIISIYKKLACLFFVCVWGRGVSVDKIMIFQSYYTSRVIKTFVLIFGEIVALEYWEWKLRIYSPEMEVMWKLALRLQTWKWFLAFWYLVCCSKIFCESVVVEPLEWVTRLKSKVLSL